MPSVGDRWILSQQGSPPPGSYWQLSWVLERPSTREGDWVGVDRNGHEKILRREWFMNGKLYKLPALHYD